MVSSIFLVLLVIITSWMAAIYKVKEVQTKEYFRDRHGSHFAFLSNKAYMQILFFCMMLPGYFTIKWTNELFIIVILLSSIRFIPWVIVANAKGKYTNTAHQVSSNFTMLENFSGPLGALFLYSLYDYMNTSEVSIVWYLITPLMGFFLLWALRDQEKPISKEMLYIIVMQAILVACETGILLYLESFEYKDFFLFESFSFVDPKTYLFLIVVSSSSFWIGLYYLKNVISDIKLGAGYDAFKIGSISAIHDFIYFVGFSLFGPIFIVARRGMIIPMQNLYLGWHESKQIFYWLKRPFQKPLLGLKGGKDFIISFVDLVFNQVVHMVIVLIH